MWPKDANQQVPAAIPHLISWNPKFTLLQHLSLLWKNFHYSLKHIWTTRPKRVTVRHASQPNLLYFKTGQSYRMKLRSTCERKILEKKKKKKKDPIFEHSPPSHFGWFWPILTQFPVAPVLFVPRSFIICCCLAAVGGILEYNKEVFKKIKANILTKFSNAFPCMNNGVFQL